MKNTKHITRTGNGKNILLVDDASLGSGLRQWLMRRAAGVNVMTARSRRHALELLEKRKIDLIIMGFYLPVMDKVELLEFMEKRDLRTPIIVMSGGDRRRLGRSTALEDRAFPALAD